MTELRLFFGSKCRHLSKFLTRTKPKPISHSISHVGLSLLLRILFVAHLLIKPIDGSYVDLEEYYARFMLVYITVS